MTIADLLPVKRHVYEDETSSDTSPVYAGVFFSAASPSA
jgi:hypothetical protein